MVKVNETFEVPVEGLDCEIEKITDELLLFDKLGIPEVVILVKAQKKF